MPGLALGHSNFWQGVGGPPPPIFEGRQEPCFPPSQHTGGNWWLSSLVLFLLRWSVLP